MKKPLPPIFEGIRLMEPGIYFGMEEDAYHADMSLGSSNMKDLAINPESYWWHSAFNRAREDDKDTPSQIRGTAVHVLVLYGEIVFDARYLRIPHTSDMSSGDKATMTKKYNLRAAAEGKIALGARVYDNVAIASAMISRNKYLSGALVGGFNEVSIFWRDEATGLPKKARIDCLKPRGVGDLKSIINKFEKPFREACRNSIAEYRYDVQARHYLDARAMIPQFFEEGRFRANSSLAVDLLQEIAEQKEYAWQWIWWQAEGPPLTYSKILSLKNPMLEVARDTILHAERNFLEFSERFGRDPWIVEEEPTELYQAEMPQWYARPQV